MGECVFRKLETNGAIDNFNDQCDQIDENQYYEKSIYSFQCL